MVPPSPSLRWARCGAVRKAERLARLRAISDDGAVPDEAALSARTAILLIGSSRRGGGAKTRVKLYLTYPSRLVREPLIYHLSRTFDLVFNIRQASINEEIGIIAIELDGTEERIEQGIAWLRERGVTVEPIEKNVIE